MAAEIIAIKCPSCGSSNLINQNSVWFGFEFHCPNCQTNSVLIKNQLLYIPSPGELICLKCGRVALKGAKFCQCGEKLVIACGNPQCRRDIPVTHEICDYCGTKQVVAILMNKIRPRENEIIERVTRELAEEEVRYPDWQERAIRHEMENDDGQSLIEDLSDKLFKPRLDKWHEIILSYNPRYFKLLMKIFPYIRSKRLFIKCHQLLIESVTEEEGESAIVAFNQKYKHCSDLTRIIPLLGHELLEEYIKYEGLAFFLISTNDYNFKNELVIEMKHTPHDTSKVLKLYFVFNNLSEEEKKFYQRHFRKEYTSVFSRK